MAQQGKNVAVIGASGNTGAPITSALLEQDFHVTAITRSTSSTSFPSKVNVQRVDYDDHSSLVAAFKGQDAVVSTIGTFSVSRQKAIIDAAVEAGVKRFLPSEFGFDTEPRKAVELIPPIALKQDIVAYLRSKEKDGCSWTAIVVGLYFDFTLEQVPLHWDLRDHRATIFDSGNQTFEATNMAQIGRAVASILQTAHLAETANKYVYIHSYTGTQNQVLAALEAATGHKWDVERSSVEALYASGSAKLAEASKPMAAGVAAEYPMGVVEMIMSAAYGFGGLNDFGERARMWNERLGLPEEDLEATIRGLVKKMGLAKK